MTCGLALTGMVAKELPIDGVVEVHTGEETKVEKLRGPLLRLLARLLRENILCRRV